MPDEEHLIENFRISIKIEQFLGFNQEPKWIFKEGETARGIQNLRGSLVKLFNQVEEYIMKNLEKAKLPETLKEVDGFRE